MAVITRTELQGNDLYVGLLGGDVYVISYNGELYECINIDKLGTLNRMKHTQLIEADSFEHALKVAEKYVFRYL